MSDTDKNKSIQPDTDGLTGSSTGALVFISHDSRDAELAEAFSKLLKSVSAGMLKCFRSTDKKGTEGFQYGDEWYSVLMKKLQAASEVVCLFTERSIDRPWILYEAGLAKAKLETRVRAIAFGVPLTRLQTGPFFHFQNCEYTEEALSKLVHELTSRIPNCEPDPDVIRDQVKVFKTTSDKIIERLSHRGEKQKAAEEEPLAKFLEEMKGLVRDLPLRVADRMAESGDPIRRRRLRRFHPMMFDEIMHMGGEPGDPIGILLAASIVREEMPWLYEIAVEAYHGIRSGDMEAAEKEVRRLSRVTERFMHGPWMDGPFMEEFGGKEARMFMMEFPRMFEHMLHRCIEARKPSPRRRAAVKPPSE
ncbi:MAG: toll/interleukin-1 receptor domain-containing protein [Verrucomicrobiia bacterium]